MTMLADRIRDHAARMPDRMAIECGVTHNLDWAQLAVALDDGVAGLRGTCGPLAIEMDQGLPLCLHDLALIEAGVPAVSIPSFFTSEQRAHVLNEVANATLPEGTARISFTSGSTGTPKGICLSADHMISVATAVVDHVGDSHAGRHLPLLPPGILLENVAGFYATILAGGTYVALAQAKVGLANPFAPDFPTMVEVIRSHGITSLIVVPEYLAGIVAVLEQSGTRLPELTLVAVGGARVPVELLDRADRLGLPVRQGYGMTECASVVALEAPGERTRGSVGTSLGLNRYRIADDGEILLDGAHCLGMPAGPFATGDIGHVDEVGRLWIDGRKSNLIVTAHGRNVSPEWVEAALLAQPAIAQAMVHGDGETALSALIVPACPDAPVGAAVAAANATLPAYARVSHWRRVPPFTPGNGQLTGNGRLRRDAIASAHLKGKGSMGFFDRLRLETLDAQLAFAAVPQLQAGLAGTISRATYIAYLTQAYHHVRHTVPLLTEARDRLAHRPEMARALGEYIAEEDGHEAWILDDIAAAGGDRDAAAASPPAAATTAMVDHAYHVIRTGNPVGLFGMVYVLEGTSVAVAERGAAAVREALDLPEAAFSYLTSHGALDKEHMRFFAELMDRMDDPADQQAIIDMARDMFGLFGAMFAAIPMEALDVAA